MTDPIDVKLKIENDFEIVDIKTEPTDVDFDNPVYTRSPLHIKEEHDNIPLIKSLNSDLEKYADDLPDQQVFTIIFQDDDAEKPITTSNKPSTRKVFAKNKCSLKCDKCHQTFPDKSSLKFHMKSYELFNKYKCRICGASLSSKTFLIRHYMAKHKSVNPFPCDHCEESFSNYNEWRDHDLTKHGSPNQNMCHLCDFSFPDKESLVCHKRGYHESFRFTCTYCNVKFNHHTALSVHIRVAHANPKKLVQSYNDDEKRYNYNCKICVEAFEEYKQLRDHMRMHNGVVLHTCDNCGISFKRENQLKLHVTMHKPETPFECLACFKNHTVKEDLVKHMIVDHGVIKANANWQSLNDTVNKKVVPSNDTVKRARPYVFECSICGVCFDKISMLNQHISNHEMHSRFRTNNSQNDKNYNPINQRKTGGEVDNTETINSIDSVEEETCPDFLFVEFTDIKVKDETQNDDDSMEFEDITKVISEEQMAIIKAEEVEQELEHFVVQANETVTIVI